MNIPDAKKKARGAQPQLADWRLIGNGARYDLEDFSSFAERVLSSPNSEGGAAGQKPASGSGDPGSIASSPVQVANLSDLGLSKDEPDALTEAIVSCIPLSDRPEMWKAPGLPDRSAVVYFVACELHRRGVEPGKIAGALLNPNWLISDHVHEQTDPTRYWIVIDNCDRPIEGTSCVQCCRRNLCRHAYSAGRNK